jgi:hypothetical protein
MDEPTYSISHFFRNRMPLNGTPRSYEFLNKVVKTMDVQPDGKSTRNAPEYKASTLESAITDYEQQKVEASSTRDELEERKLEKEIEKYDEQIKKHRYENEQLRNRLVDTQEVADFLAERRTVELALLRRLLFVDMPLDVPGTTVPQAREKGTVYYNKLVEAYNQASRLWEERYERVGVENNNLVSIIEQIEQAFEKSGKDHQSSKAEEDSRPTNN